MVRQAGNPQPSDQETFLAQKVAQHPAIREQLLQMQRVYPVHDFQIDYAGRTGHIIAAAPVDTQRTSLARYRQLV